MKWLRKLAGLVQEGSLYVLLFLLPFSKASVAVSFAFLFFAWLFQRLDPKTRTQTLWLQPSLRPLAWAIAAYFGACVLSVIVSGHVWLSIYGLIGKWLKHLLFLVIVADVACRPRVVKRSLKVLSCSTALVLLEALTQERYGTGFFLKFRLDYFGRMTGPYENPIDLATYLMVVIPILFAFTLVRHKPARWQLWGLLILLAACFIRTRAAGAWLGLAGGLLLFLALNTPLRRAGLLVLVALTLASGFALHRGGRLGQKAFLSDIGTVDRWHMWQAAIGMIRDRPILGHGVNTFMANYLTYWVGGQKLPRYAHNCYLQVAAEAGLVGLLTFLRLLWLWFGRLMVGLRHLPPSQDQTLLIGFIVGLFAFLLHSGLDTNFYSLRQAALFWVLAGLTLGLSSKGSSETSATSPLSRQRLVA